MEDIPLEIKENILLFAEPKSILSLCSISRDFYSLACNYHLWKEKFSREGLRLNKKAETPAQWVKEYIFSLKSKLQAKESLRRLANESISLALECFNSINFLRVGKVDINFILLEWRDSREEYLLRLKNLDGLNILPFFPRALLEKKEKTYLLTLHYQDPRWTKSIRRSFSLTLSDVDRLLYDFFYDNPMDNIIVYIPSSPR